MDNNWLMWQTIVLAITCIMVFWYSYETRWLRTETHRLVEGQQRPLVIMESMGSEGLTLTNVGNGSAVNVRVLGVMVDIEEAVRVKDTKPASVRSSRLITYIVPGKTVNVPLETFQKGWAKGQISHTHGRVSLSDTIDIFVFRIEFENMAMQPYFVEEVVHSGTLKIFRTNRIKDRAGKDLLTIRTSQRGEVEDVSLTAEGRKGLTAPL